MVEPLRDSKFFARVFVELGTLTWPNGYDLDSIALHDEMQQAGLLHRTAAYVSLRVISDSATRHCGKSVGTPSANAPYEAAKISYPRSKNLTYTARIPADRRPHS